uniref:RING-type domain-containing protein n=1 Tax=Caenorhabditis tropicalis TaxID=1561998 RepID=A0A1I7UX13_9PELO
MEEVEESKEIMKELRKEKDLASNDIEVILKEMGPQQNKSIAKMIETNTMDTYNKDDCAICLNGFFCYNRPHELSCGQRFHRICLDTHINIIKEQMISIATYAGCVKGD